MNSSISYHRFTRFAVFLLIALVALSWFSGEAAAFLHRVGPLNPDPTVGNFPAWYQDNTGITLEFCAPDTDNTIIPATTEVDGGWCLLLPGDVTTPEVFPANFFDEHFYYAADAGVNLGVPATQTEGTAKLVIAVESAFAAGVAPGGQIAFSRIRVRLDLKTGTLVPGAYRFIHPYGEEIVEVGAGVDRIFVTDDVGIACAPGDFTCALQSRLGPFLLPSPFPGGPEIGPVTAAVPTPDDNVTHFPGGFTAYPGTGKSYIADPARLGPVTGSPLPDFTACDNTGTAINPTPGLCAPGTQRNHNIFRIEGPAGSNLDGSNHSFVESSVFTLVGRIREGSIPGEITVDRANYARNADATVQKVEVYATGFPTIQGRLPGAPILAPVVPQLSFFDAPCGLAPDNTTFIAPTGQGLTETQMANAGNNYWASVQQAAIPTGVCVNENGSPNYFQKSIVDEVTVSEAFFDNNAQTLSVKARSSDEFAPPTLTLGQFDDLANGSILVSPLAAPPSHVHVQSSYGGTNVFQVTTNGSPAGAATGVTLSAIPDSPQLPGAQVAFIAAGQGIPGTYYYQFSDNVSGTLTVTQPFSPLSARVWDTTGVPGGTYAIQVDVSSNLAGPSEASASMAFTLTNPGPATGVLITPDQPSPHLPGTAVLFFANGLGSSGYQYRFLLHDGVNWSMVQDYGVGSSWSLPGSTSAGSYTVAVDVRTSTLVNRDTVGYLSYQIGNPAAPATGVDITPDQTSPHQTGTAVLFTASGTGSSGYQYRFWLHDGVTWTKVQDYGVGDTWSLPGSTPAGSYTIAVDVRTSTLVDRDTVNYLPYEIVP